MLQNDLIGFGLFIAFFIVAGLPPILFKVYLNTSFEATRKMYHLLINLSIFPLLKLFSTWYMAVFAVFAFVLLVYPILVLGERSSFYQRIAVEREDGEFKKSLLIIQVLIANLIFIFWGLLGIDWQYVAVVAVLAGDLVMLLPHWREKYLEAGRFSIRGLKGRKPMKGPWQCSLWLG
ncbi:MAG: hypothetical protein ACK2U1_19855 [Anaerolineales bacterium]